MTDESLLRLRFGAEVDASDGPLGVLHGVLLNPRTGCVCGVVLRTGFLVSRELRVPWESVLTAGESAIRVSLTSAAAQALRGEPAQCSGSAGNGLAPRVLSDMLPVRVPGGTLAGHVRLLLVAAETGEIREYVVESGLFTRQARRLPAAWVREITPAALKVEASPGDLAGLPGFRGDRELRADILNAWFYDDRIRLTLLHAPVDVHVSSGVARVEGCASTRELGRRLEARARGVSGVVRVEGRIVTDEDLAPEVTAALAGDPRTRALRPEVQSCLGVITLQGEAPDLAAHTAASEVAAAVPGVSGVLNQLGIRGRGGRSLPVRPLKTWFERRADFPAGTPRPW